MLLVESSLMRLVVLKLDIQRRYMQPACVASWPSTESISAGWKIDFNGSVGERRSTGRANEKAIDATDSSMPLAMSWYSEERLPSKERAEREYAEMRQ